MARVIEVNTPGAERVIVHKECGAKVGYYPIEIKSFVQYDYGGGSDNVYYIICPNCGKQIQNLTP